MREIENGSESEWAKAADKERETGKACIRYNTRELSGKRGDEIGLTKIKTKNNIYFVSSMRNERPKSRSLFHPFRPASISLSFSCARLNWVSCLCECELVEYGVGFILLMLTSIWFVILFKQVPFFSTLILCFVAWITFPINVCVRLFWLSHVFNLNSIHLSLSLLSLDFFSCREKKLSRVSMVLLQTKHFVHKTIENRKLFKYLQLVYIVSLKWPLFILVHSLALFLSQTSTLDWMNWAMLQAFTPKTQKNKH